MVIIENTVEFMGQYIFSDMLGPVIDDYLNHYQYEFELPSPVRGQNTTGIFELDLRNIANPQFTDHHVDFFMAGDLIRGEEGCELTNDNLRFIENITESQIVISEAAATCWANQIARSDIGSIHMDTELSKLFWDSDVGFNSTSESVHFPFLERKLGPNKPLELDIAFRNFTVGFNFLETDIIMSYTVDVNLAVQPSEGILLSDSFELITRLNLATEDGYAYLTVIENKLSSEGESRKLPILNDIGLTEIDYHELRSNLSLYLDWLKKYFNLVYLKTGVKLPFDSDEISSRLVFDNKLVTILIQLEEDAERWFEEKYWDSDAIE